jgi:carbonic anhydrase
VTDDALRSLAVACHVLSVDTVVVMQHTNCGITRITDDELRTLTGADLDFATIGDHASDLIADVDVLKSKPYLSQLAAIAGVVYDTETGSIEEVVRWQRDAEA